MPKVKPNKPKGKNRGRKYISQGEAFDPTLRTKRRSRKGDGRVKRKLPKAKNK